MTVPRDVVIPAGGRIDAAYARAIGTPHRALAPLGPARRPVMQWVVDALRASGVVRQIIGVAAAPVAAQITGVDRWLTAGASGPGNILKGLAALEDANAPALVCTSDLPLLTPEAVRGFVSKCASDADLSFGLVRAADYGAAFPAAPASQWVQLRDAGPVTLGGLFGVRPAPLQRGEAPLRRVFEGRKSQIRMVRLLGPRLVWQWATHSLTLTALTAWGEAILGVRAQVLTGAAPALAFDIDTLDDYTFANIFLESRADAARPV